jgi:2-keto-3-deoxy-6-phosphogluconate aldolase
VCQWLFYLESTDYLNDEVPAKVAVGATFQDLPVDHAATPKAMGADTVVQPIVSLHVITDIYSKNTMLLPVTVHGHQLVALLDSGSATNFIKADLMHRL